MFPFLIVAAIVGYILLSNSKSANQIANMNSQPVYSFVGGKAYTLVVGAVPGSTPGQVQEGIARFATISGAYTLGNMPDAPTGKGTISTGPGNMSSETVDEWYVPIVAQRPFMLGDVQTVYESANDSAVVNVIGAMAG